MASISQQSTDSSTSTQPRPPPSQQPRQTQTTTTTTTPSSGQYVEYTLSSLRHSQSTRNHVMKLHVSRPIDPLTPSNNPQGWTHPLKLHRRDPNVPLLRPDTTPADPDQKDVKAQIDLSVIAPYGGAQKAKKDLFKPKTKQVFHSDPQELQLRNEERTPWVLEDFEGKNTWVGTLEGGGASGYALFLFDTEGFKLVPVDRTYRFSKKGATQVLSAEEAEEQMKKRSSLPRWILKDR